ATTLDEYRKYIEKDAALARRFQAIIVNPPSMAETVEILKGLRDRYEVHHRVQITDAALKAAVELSERSISVHCPPDKAIDVIAEVVSKMTGVPLKKVGEDETRRLLNMEAELHGTVISQDEAIKAISKAVRKSRSGMKDPKRPIGSFIFAGPTGVGKTLLAKQ